MKYDFSGWATKANLRCSDGRTIMQGAFKDDDGVTVPLVWNHEHNDPEHVLGHALLENRNEGVYAYCSFNETESGKNAKKLVQHGDVSSLSIYANGLRQNGNNVMHGQIREVSLVLAGANPGARIMDVVMHGDIDDTDEEAIICTGDTIELSHADCEKKEEKKDMPKEEEKKLEYAKDGEEKEASNKTVGDVLKTLNEDQMKVLKYLVGMAAEGKNPEEKDEEDTEEDTTVKHNVFDRDQEINENVISHSDMEAVIGDAKRYGSMKESALQHGIEDIDYLFPDAKTVNNTPDFIQREQSWVKDVLNGAHHSPFSRIKSVHADITEDDARALGYLPDRTHRDAKGNLVDAEGNPAYKKEEVFSLLKRTTTPATIYKKQKLDRDDVIDITDFDVVSWIKSEMRVMLDEEIARAVLVGDGRLSSSDDKINESNIRPVWKDDNLYTIKTAVTVGTDDAKTAGNMVDQVVRALVNYKGSGNTTYFCDRKWLTEALLLKDLNGHRLYANANEVAMAMGVNKIVPVDVMKNLTRTSGSDTMQLMGIVVDMKDYFIGADKGGNVSLFEDFDIDYNAQKYLIETRCSGALVKPYSAIAVEFVKP